jgi:8-amino-7-oxononanoate synthase
MKSISDIVAIAKQMGFYPNLPTLNSPHTPETLANGRAVLLFTSNNYLGMMTDERVVAAATEGCQKWGIGSGASRLLGGSLDIHTRLEEALADFKKKDACVTFPTGFMANSGTIPAVANVMNPSVLMLDDAFHANLGTVIFSDEYNHGSIRIAISTSRSPKEIFKHSDMADLKNRLKKYPAQKRKLIVVDGVFSMDGDIAPLPDILGLAREYGAMVYVDDAHATGILGKHGRGTEDYFEIEGQVDIMMGTLTKAFGGLGGFVVGSNSLIDYLRISAATYILTAPIPPPVVCGLIRAIELVREEPWRRERLLENAKYLREAFLEMDLNICGSQTQIIPIWVGDEQKSIAAAKLLLENDIFVPNAMWPAVPTGQARLRISVMYNHTKDQMDKLISVVRKIKHKVLDK